MALDLSSIAFKVETKELDDAVSKLGDLQKAVSNLNKPLNASTVATEKLAQAQAKTAKANADAAAATAKAELAQVRLEKTTTGNALAQAKLAKTTEATTTVTKNSTTALERQQQILEYMTQGFSKGQSSVLTYAKSTGLLSNELEELGKVLQTQRKLVGGDPFDKSTGGLESLKNKLTEAREANRLYTAGIDLTASQTKELARDKERIIEKMKLEGASLTDIKNKLKEHNAAYIAVADAVNRLDRAETAKMATDKATGKATDYLTREMNRAENALAGLNNEVAISSSNRLLRFKEGLIASGVATDVAAAKYQAYAKVIAETDKKRAAQQKSDEQSRINNLSRGLAPQISDVAVSLYGGMSPMTVLMQQGLQVRDLIQSSGVEAGKLNEVLKKTGADFIGTIGGTFKAVGGLAVGFFQSAGAGVVDFAMKVTGADGMLKAFAKTSDEAAAGVAKFSGIVSTAVGATVAATIVTLIALAVAMKQVIQEESALTKAINVTGLSMGLSKDAAVEYAKSFESIGVSQSKAIGVITEMAKHGGFTKEAIQSVTKAAIDLEKYAGVSIETTVNNFAKFQDKPYEALVKVATQTGLVTQAQLDNIKTLEQQGKQAEATAEAIRLYGEVTQAQADLSKLSLSSIETLWLSVKSAIGGAWEEIKNLARGESFVNLLSDAFKVVQTVVSTVWYSIKQLNTALGAAAAIAGAMLSDNMSGAIEAGKQVISGWKEAANNQQGYLDNLWKAADAQNNVSTGLKLTAQQIEKNVVQSKAQAEWEKLTGDLVDRKTKREEGALRIRNQGLAAGKSELEIQKAIAVWNEKNKDPAKKKVPISYEKTLILEAEKEMVKATDAADEYTKSWERILVLVSGADEKFNALTSTQKANVLSTFAGVAAKEAENKEWEAANKIMDETSKAMKQATIEADKLAKAREQRGISEVTNAQNKLALLDEELADMLLQKAIYGDLTVEQKKQIEYAKIQKEYKAEELRIAKLLADSKNNIDAAKAQELRDINYLAAAKKRQNIDQAIILENNKYEYEQRVQLADGISSSIEAALFEGGQAGSQKLRDVLEAELRKPITLFIQAFVQDIFGLSGDSGDSLTKASKAFDTVSNLLNGSSISSGIGSAFEKFATGSFGQKLGLSTPTGYTTGSGTTYGVTSTGSSIGSALGMFGNASTGYGLSKAIGNGYKTGLGNTVDNIGAIASAIPSVGPIAGVISGLVNRAFGRKLTDSGIQGSFGTEGFTGNSFTFEKGGWLRSDRTKTSELDKGTQSALSSEFKSFQIANATMATALGLSTDAIENFAYDMKVSFFGLTESQIQEKLAEQFGIINEKMAESLLVGTDYAKLNEKASETLARLADSLTAVNGIFEVVGFTLSEVSLKGANAASAIIEAYGGLVQFTSIMSEYYNEYFTQEEKRANVISNLGKELRQAGIDITDADLGNKTKQQYREMIESYESTVGATDRTTIALLKGAAAFAGVTDSIEEATKKLKEQQEEELKKSGDLRKEELKAQREIEKLKEDQRAKELEDYKLINEKFLELREGLLKSGDAAGLLAKTLENAFANPNGTYTAGGQQYSLPTWQEGATAAQFNYAYGIMAAKIKQDLSNDISANALRVENAGAALSKYSVNNMLSQYDSVTGPIYIGIRDSIAEAAGDTGYVIRDAVDSASLLAAQGQVRGAYSASGPGLASVYAAMAQPQMIADNARAYNTAISNLNGALRSGSISTEQFGKAVEALEKVIPKPGTVEEVAAAIQGAVYAIGRAGYESIKFYFGQLSELSSELAEKAKEAAEPISKMTSSIGRLNSFATAFGTSAQAAMNLPSASIAGYGTSLEYAAGTIGTSAMISQAAAIASSVLTTADAAQAAERLSELDSFSEVNSIGIRNASLLLDGINQFDAQSFENAFIKITDAYAKGNLTGDQFVDVFGQALDSFKGIDEETQNLVTSMQNLGSVMKNFAEELLINTDKTTLTSNQVYSEIERQYAQAYSLASTGDTVGIANFQQLSGKLLDKSLYANQSEYNSSFGRVYGDALTLESIANQNISSANSKQDEVINELKEMNNSLGNKVQTLEMNLSSALAVIARNTAKTSQGIEQINTVGITTS